MIILAIESSGMVASAAVVEENKVLAEFSVNNKKTHSQTLLPMISVLRKTLELELSDLDAVAVSKGPGSFTGLRIGSATAKGLALALEKPVVEVSSLEAMAYQVFGTDALICPMMDARRAQVYTSLFTFEGERFTRVTQDAPMSVEDRIAEVNRLGKTVIFLGDGVPVYETQIRTGCTVPFLFAPPYMNRQRSAALGLLAVEYAKQGKMVDADMHRPEYLRLSQAERERMEKKHD